MSLQDILLQELKNRRHLTFNEMESLCKANGKKVSNGEKRLRDLRSPMLTKNGSKQPNLDYDPLIGVETNPKGAIIAYTYGILNKPQSDTVSNFLKEFPSKVTQKIEQKEGVLF